MVDLIRLAGQGRAFSGARAWTPEELDALLLLEDERGINRMVAADYIRNGIVTLEAFDAATDAQFVPKTLEQSAIDAEAALKDNEFAVAPEVTPAAEEPVVASEAEPAAEEPAADPTETVAPENGKK